MNEIRFKAACQRGSCGWLLSGTNYHELIASFLAHLTKDHSARYMGTIAILELGCEDAWEDLDALFEE